MLKKLSNMAPVPSLDADFCLSKIRAGTQRPARKDSQVSRMYFSRIIIENYVSKLNITAVLGKFG